MIPLPQLAPDRAEAERFFRPELFNRIDDFIVTLTEDNGVQKTFRRDGEVPKVVINDPLKPHKDLLAKYTDADIHNITSYLVTIK